MMRPPFLQKQKNIFFGKGLDKPVEIVYTKVTLIKNETLVSIHRPDVTFLTTVKHNRLQKSRHIPHNRKEVIL
jgi:hypothetical protein